MAKQKTLRIGIGPGFSSDTWPTGLVALSGRTHGRFTDHLGYGAVVRTLTGHGPCGSSPTAHFGAGFELVTSLGGGEVYGLFGPQLVVAGEGFHPGAVVGVGLRHTGVARVGIESACVAPGS